MSNKIGGEHGCFGTPDMPRTTYLGEESGKLFYCRLSRSKGYPYLSAPASVYLYLMRGTPYIPEILLLQLEGVWFGTA